MQVYNPLSKTLETSDEFQNSEVFVFMFAFICAHSIPFLTPPLVWGVGQHPKSNRATKHVTQINKELLIASCQFRPNVLPINSA